MLSLRSLLLLASPERTSCKTVCYDEPLGLFSFSNTVVVMFGVTASRCVEEKDHRDCIEADLHPRVVWSHCWIMFSVYLCVLLDYIHFFMGGGWIVFFSFSAYTFLVVWLAVSKMFESNWWFLFLFFLFSETSFAFGFVSHCKHVSKGVHMSFFNICMYVCRHRTPRSEWKATDICIYKYFFPLSRIRGFTQYLEWILTLGVEHSSR